MFGSDGERKPCYNVALMNRDGNTVKTWQIKRSYSIDEDGYFEATTTADKVLRIQLGRDMTLVIEEV